MSDAVSAGLLLWRRTAEGPQFLLVHPGGPFWAKKDEAAWSIPKGLVDDGEDLRAAASREFAEETGHAAPDGGVALPPCRTPGRKLIHAWLVEGDLDPDTIASNLFTMGWPPKSGKTASFPEVDRAAWFGADDARLRIHRGQQPLLDAALALLDAT